MGAARKTSRQLDARFVCHRCDGSLMGSVHPPLCPPFCTQERDPWWADLILLDSRMGGGERDGLPTIRRIRELYTRLSLPAPPIVILSGETDPAAVEAFKAAGAVQVLRKPVSLITLRELLQLVTRRRGEELATEGARGSAADRQPVGRSSACSAIAAAVAAVDCADVSLDILMAASADSSQDERPRAAHELPSSLEIPPWDPSGI